jgi:hypothetical protein
MSENHPKENQREAVERMKGDREEGSDAAWRPFEEKWADVVEARYDRLHRARRNKFTRGTPAEFDAEAKLNELLRRIAAEAAETAHTKDFKTRRGFRVLDFVLGGDCLCVVYNNNPYAGMSIRRDQELKQYRRWLAGEDAVELAYAEHPGRGKDEGYSYALLLRCDPAYVGDLWEQYRAITLKSLTDMPPPNDEERPEW